MLATRSDWQILGRFSQLLEETEHLCGWRQEKVAKIVQCGGSLCFVGFVNQRLYLRTSRRGFYIKSQTLDSAFDNCGRYRSSFAAVLTQV